MEKAAVDFDQVIDRRQTGSRKWDGREAFFGSSHVLPMWIADMDFKAPPAVMQAVLDCAQQGVYGYPYYKKEYYTALEDWLKRRHGWKVREEWILRSPGVMPAVSAAILAFTRPNDKVIIQPPVYPAFFDCIKKNGRQVVENVLLVEGGRYVMDIDNLEMHMQGGAKVLLLCSPHNPVGRVWSTKELCQVAGLCERYDVLVLTDEIHSDIVFCGHAHTPFAAVSPELARRTVTFTAPGKTFNTSGFYTAAVIASDQQVRNCLQGVLEALEIDKVNLMGVAAATAAYQYGEEWLKQLLLYLEKNAAYIQQFMHDKIPQISVTSQEGTYLMWLDFRKLNLTHEQLNSFLINDAKVALSDGKAFGQAGFMRMNFGCPRSVLQDGLTRIAQAVMRKKKSI